MASKPLWSLYEYTLVPEHLKELREPFSSLSLFAEDEIDDIVSSWSDGDFVPVLCSDVVKKMFEGIGEKTYTKSVR